MAGPQFFMRHLWLTMETVEVVAQAVAGGFLVVFRVPTGS